MKNQKNRSMKVYSQNGRNYKATPTIILKGQWLEEMRFAIGDYISVSCENGKLVITPDTERAELEDVEADSGGETEAGTTQRDVVRHGVARIPVSFSVTAKWLKKLAGYAKMDKISVQYFDVETAELKLAEMYVTGYKAKLRKDTSYKGLWTVSFTLKEM